MQNEVTVCHYCSLEFDRRRSLSRDSSATNMAAEDLPSEFDVVILGTGSVIPRFYFMR